MQHAYVQAYTHLGQFAGRSSFATWLTRIAVHEALARARRRRRDLPAHPLAEPGEEAMVTLESEDPNPEQLALRGELCALLESSIEGLPVAYRSVLVLREVEGLSTAETADCLEITEDAVKPRLHRARALLREELFERAGIAAATAFSFHLSRCDRIVAAVFQRLDPGRMSTFTENAASGDALARTVECRGRRPACAIEPGSSRWRASEGWLGSGRRAPSSRRHWPSWTWWSSERPARTPPPPWGRCCRCKACSSRRQRSGS
jgi:RNA polymerase sigma-70 factor (ECF subfamily)